MELLIHYNKDKECLMAGLPYQIAHYLIKEPKPKHPKHSFILRVCNNIHNIANLENVEFMEEFEVEEKIPVKRAPPPAA